MTILQNWHVYDIEVSNVDGELLLLYRISRGVWEITRGQKGKDWGRLHAKVSLHHTKHIAFLKILSSQSLSLVNKVSDYHSKGQLYR